jgi:hypothetical protein
MDNYGIFTVNPPTKARPVLITEYTVTEIFSFMTKNEEPLSVGS